MKRRKRIVKNYLLPDIFYNSLEISKFINVIMLHGKKSISSKIVYKALNYIKIKFKKNPLYIFFKAIDNVSPMIEIKKRKVGGSNYNIPVEIRNSRRISLGMNWIKRCSRERVEKYMYLRLANEIIDSYYKRSKSIKKKEDIYRISDSNRSYCYY